MQFRVALDGFVSVVAQPAVPPCSLPWCHAGLEKRVVWVGVTELQELKSGS